MGTILKILVPSFYFLNLFTISSKLSTKNFTSSNVFSFPNVILKLPLAKIGFIPVASKTCDGLINPALHAEPLDAHIPFLSNSTTNLLPSTPEKHILLFPG